MTAPGALKHDATGRSSGRRKGNRKSSIPGQFAWRTTAMLESPAYRVLSQSGHRIISRLEIEFGRHGGNPQENGSLPCTYDDFERYGIHRHAIAPALREVVALGFVEITRQGRAGNAEFRQPHLFRLTYRHAYEGEPTDEWRRIQSVEEAQAIQAAARSKKRNSSGGFCQCSVAESAPKRAAA